MTCLGEFDVYAAVFHIDDAVDHSYFWLFTPKLVMWNAIILLFERITNVSYVWLTSQKKKKELL